VENVHLHPVSLVGDQLVERLTNIPLRNLGHVAALVAEKYEPESALLVAEERLPRTVTIDANPLGRQYLFDDVRRSIGESQRGEQSECNSVTVSQRVPRPGLEGV